MKRFLFVVMLFLLETDGFAQIQWQKCLGGSNYDVAKTIQQTFDGGYILAGESSSNDGDLTSNQGDEDIWVVKLSPSGSIQWQKSIGGIANDRGGYTIQTADSGYIMASYSFSNNGDVSGNHGQLDIWVVKFSVSGSIQWQKCYGGIHDESSPTIQQTTDGGYIIACYTNSNDGDISGYHAGQDCWILKISATGSIQWQKCYGGSGNDMPSDIHQTVDGGYIVTGVTTSNDGDVACALGAWVCFVLKLNAVGTIEWHQCFGGSSVNVLRSIKQTSDGGYIAVGYTTSTDGDFTGNHGAGDCWVLKLAADGSKQWQHLYGGSSDEDAGSVIFTADGGYIIAGGSNSNDGNVFGNHGGTDSWVIKLSAGGAVEWQKSLGSTGGEGFTCIYPTSDGGYILGGNTDGNNGDVSGNHGGLDFWVVKLGSKTSVNNIDKTAVTIFPNPATNMIQISGIDLATIRVYNVNGQLVKESTQTNEISIADLPSSVYFVRLFDGLELPVYQTKIIKQ